MKFYLYLILEAFFVVSADAQYPQNMDKYSFTYGNFTFHDIDCHYLLGVPYNCHESEHIKMEIPPWTIGGGWHTYFFSNGNETNTYSDPNDMTSKVYANIEGHGPFFAIAPNASQPWKRNYCEIFSAHYLQHPSQGPINLAFCHNENKNQCGSQNTINPSIPVDCSVAGNDWRAYYALVSAAYTPNNASNNWGQQGGYTDLGPIFWPSVGFIAPDNSSASQGILQPSSIIDGDFVYVFVYDCGPRSHLVGGQEGRTRGIKLLRAKKADCLDPSKYEVYYKDPSGSIHWLPSLPAGFTKENMLQYVRVQGPKSTDILDQIPGNTACMRFSVARVTGQDYFMGCEEYLDPNDSNANGVAKHHVAIRFSYDLMNWSKRVAIVETAGSWDASQMNYPIFLSADGWSNTAVEINDFYILGVHSTSPFPNWVTTLHVQLQSPQLRMAIITDHEPIIYPNPVHTQLTLDFYHKGSAGTRIVIYDQTGRQVKVVESMENTGWVKKYIDVSFLKQGIYFVRLFDGQIKTWKIVKC